jgi:nitrous oxidase accessory protein
MFRPTTLTTRIAMTLLALAVLLLGALLLAPPADGQAPATAPRELRVGPGEAYARIADALAAAQDGDRVRVRPGVYREGTLVVEREVALIGEGWPVLDGSEGGDIVRVMADGVTVRGFVLRNAQVHMLSDNAAVRVGEVAGCTIEENRLEENYFGIYLAKSRDCRVAHNHIRASGTRESQSGNGIHLWNSTDVEIEGNDIAGHRDGVYLEFAARALLRHNTSAQNLRYGLHFMFTNDSEYLANTFRHNGAGVAVMYSKNVHMIGNEFIDNWGPAAYGLLLKDISDSRIEDNTFRRNTVGMLAEGALRMQVRGNHFVRNGWATRVRQNSRDNTFAANNFIDNAFDVTTDSRQNRNTFAGNYWSRYTGYDLTGDGYGDVPHRPVRLFSLVVERNPTALVLLRTFFVDLLDLAERVLPVLTPETLVDETPRIRELPATRTAAGAAAATPRAATTTTEETRS